jgi:hypothetical protein
VNEKDRHLLVDARREQERLVRHHHHHAHVLGIEHEPGGDTRTVGVEPGNLVAEHSGEHLLATRTRFVRFSPTVSQNTC